MLRGILPNAEIAILRRKKSSLISGDANHFFSKWSQVRIFKPDLAVICTPASIHLNAVRMLAPLGVHIFIEKPITASLTDAFELADLVSKFPIKVMVGYNLRFSPSLVFFRECINNKLIGKILSVRCEVGKNITTWRPDTDYKNSVSANPEMGGGVLLELSHEIDYLQWVFGEIQFVCGSLSRKQSLNINVEDEANLIFDIKSNASESRITVSLNMDFVRWDATRYCLAIGELGTLKWDAILGEVFLFDKDSKSWKSVYLSKNDLESSYRNQFIEFMNNLNIANSPSPSVVDGLKTLMLVDAIKNTCTLKIV